MQTYQVLSDREVRASLLKIRMAASSQGARPSSWAWKHGQNLSGPASGAATSTVPSYQADTSCSTTSTDAEISTHYGGAPFSGDPTVRSCQLLCHLQCPLQHVRGSTKRSSLSHLYWFHALQMLRHSRTEASASSQLQTHAAVTCVR